MKGRKWICFLLAFVLLAGVLPLNARAIDLIDPDKAVSLTVTSKTGETLLVGAQFDLYRVASADTRCDLTPCKDFAPYITGDLNSMDADEWEALTRQLYEAVIANPGDFTWAYSAKTGEEGKAVFNVTRGLYLVVGRLHTQDFKQYAQNPILIMLPNRVGESQVWDYDVEMNTKPGEVKDARNVKIFKDWDDKNDAAGKRPEKLEVYILREDGLKLEATLPHNGQWSYTWTDLEPGHTWIAGEVTDGLKNYKLTDIVKDESANDCIVFTLRNRYTQPYVPEEKLPQTGQLWWPVPVLLAAGLFLILVGMIRRRGERHEN